MERQKILKKRTNKMNEADIKGVKIFKNSLKYFFKKRANILKEEK